MRTSITKIFTFEAAHQLPDHKGKCANLHGHSYRLEVTITGGIKTDGSSSGMVMDFSDIAEVVEREVLMSWDHQFLNEKVDFRTTVELLAGEVFKRLKQAGLPVVKIKLWETARGFAEVEAVNV